MAACFDGIDTPASPGFAAAEARARQAGEKEVKNVIAYLKKHGLGNMVSNPRSKAAQMLSVHRNPRTAVNRWYGRDEKAAQAGVPTLPPIPGSRVVGSISDQAR